MQLSREMLHSGASEALREMIVSGEMEPGSKIREAELCERLGISRTPLREALKVMASEGLIQLVPRHGSFVAQITETEINELFPIMAALEALAGELACARMSNKEIAAFRELHRELFARFEAEDEREYLRINREIHRHFFTVAGNNALASMFEQMLVRTHLARFVARRTRAQWQRAVDEHRAILAAIEAREGKRLGDLLRIHLLGTGVEIVRGTLPSGRS
ncbi:MAG TPA: GntR family transcriptional regulator [Devosiaceae bacterium]|nr:GntR family transcriptional regulator [Devosiaceae bacterium]